MEGKVETQCLGVPTRRDSARRSASTERMSRTIVANRSAPPLRVVHFHSGGTDLVPAGATNCVHVGINSQKTIQEDGEQKNRGSLLHFV